MCKGYEQSTYRRGNANDQYMYLKAVQIHE